ncbi:hypothetical protein M1349_00830 [Patescibacteria group bacterium]|nr:hypothetical protein [Patescibacteria group bacterium]
MSEEKGRNQLGEFTPAEIDNPAGEIKKIWISEFNNLSKTVFGINQICGTLPQLEMAKEEIVDEFGETIARTGITLENHYLRDFGSFDLQIRIVEPEKTVEFLRTIDDASDKDTKKSMIFLMQSIFEQIDYEYGKKNGPNDETIGLTLGLDSFIQEFTRLSIPTEGMEDYLRHAKSQTLKEYVLVIKSGILIEPEGKGNTPSDWHLSFNPDVLAKTWAHAFDVLDKIKENDLAGELFDDVLICLELSIESALRDTRQHEGEKETLDVLLIVKDVLSHYRDDEEAKTD